MTAVQLDEVVRILSTSDLASETTHKLITPITETYVNYHKSRSKSTSEGTRMKSILPLQAYLHATCKKTLTAKTQIPLGIALFLYSTVLTDSDTRVLLETVAGYAQKPSDLVPFAVLLGKDVYAAVHQS